MRYRTSALTSLVNRGVEFTHAQTPVVSNLFPGMVGQVTGCDPGVTGVYYDDTFNHALDPAGTTDCRAFEAGRRGDANSSNSTRSPLHRRRTGLAGLPGNILHMTGNPATLIDPSQLPVDPPTCQPVYPQNYLKVNPSSRWRAPRVCAPHGRTSIARTTILNGPSGNSIEDLFTPEINSNAPTSATARLVDGQRVDHAVRQLQGDRQINAINGFDHSGTRSVGTPALFGMNFQTVSTAEKLPVSDGFTGGYEADGVTPGPLLRRALGYINTEMGRMMKALKLRGLDRSTVIVLSAKHGQSPQPHRR